MTALERKQQQTWIMIGCCLIGAGFVLALDYFARNIIAATLGFFPVQFVLVGTIYLLGFITFVVLFEKLTGKQEHNTPFRSAFRNGCTSLYKRKEWWKFFLASFVVTCLIANEAPDAGPVIDGLRKIPAATFSASTREAAEQNLNRFLYGEPNPKNPTLWPDPPEIHPVESTPGDFFLQVIDWRRLRFWFFFLLIVSFLFETYEESLAAVKKMLEKSLEYAKKHRAEAAEQKAQAQAVAAAAGTAKAQKNQAQPQPPQPVATATTTVPTGGANPPTVSATATIAQPPAQPTPGPLPKNFFAQIVTGEVAGNLLSEAIFGVLHAGLHEWMEQRNLKKGRLATL